MAETYIVYYYCGKLFNYNQHFIACKLSVFAPLAIYTFKAVYSLNVFQICPFYNANRSV